jgi:hypothetical protein
MVRSTQIMHSLAFTYNTIHVEFTEFNKSLDFAFNFNFDDIDFENMELVSQELNNHDHLSMPFDFKQAFIETDLSTGLDEERDNDFQVDGWPLILPTRKRHG